MTSALLTTKIKGHVLVKDKNTDEVLLDKFNAVHNQNMATAIARGLSNYAADSTTGIRRNQVYQLKLGNGGSNIDSQSQITYLPPNVTGTGATLYNYTYGEVIDGLSGGPTDNSVTMQASPAPALTSIVICTCTIAAGEPTGQNLTDTPPNPDPNAPFAFDELGLFTFDGLLLTHIIFSPILKTANRELVITYTLTVSVS